MTDFLASHNISAHQIRLDHERRRQEAQAQNPQEDDQAVAGPSNTNANTTTADGNNDDDDDDDDEDDEGASKRKGKRKLATQKAIDKIKASKRFQKRKKRLQDSDEEDGLIEELLRNSGPAPGQIHSVKTPI